MKTYRTGCELPTPPHEGFRRRNREMKRGLVHNRVFQRATCRSDGWKDRPLVPGFQLMKRIVLRVRLVRFSQGPVEVYVFPHPHILVVASNLIEGTLTAELGGALHHPREASAGLIPSERIEPDKKAGERGSPHPRLPPMQSGQESQRRAESALSSSGVMSTSASNEYEHRPLTGVPCSGVAGAGDPLHWLVHHSVHPCLGSFRTADRIHRCLLSTTM